MLRRLLFAWGAIAFLPVTPVAAQESAVTDPTALMRDMFPAEPLTAEQEARLPAAQALADRMVPDGVYAEVIDDTLQVMLGPLMTMVSGRATDATLLSMRLGFQAEDIAALSEAERLEIAALLDPAHAERAEAATAAMMVPLRDIMVAVEPRLRTGLARAYAARYDQTELAAIDAFFATPAGRRFAGELLPIFADPQVVSASLETLPQIMERLPQITEAITAAMATLPPERGFVDLRPEERARLATLLGVDQGMLKRSMAATQPVVTTPPPVIIPAN